MKCSKGEEVVRSKTEPQPQASMQQACCKCTSACMKNVPKWKGSLLVQGANVPDSLHHISGSSLALRADHARTCLRPNGTGSERVRNGFGTGSKKCVNFFECRSAIRWQCCGNAFGNSAQSLTKVAASAPPLHSRTFQAATCRSNLHLERSSKAFISC